MTKTYSVIEPDGEGGWQIATIGGVQFARRPLRKPYTVSVLRPAWINHPSGIRQELTDGRLIVLDVVPALGTYDRIDPDPASATFDVEGHTATWPKVSAAPFEEDTHHAPEWDGTQWLAPVAKAAQEIADAVAKAAATKRLAINAERERRIYLPIGPIDLRGDGTLMVEPDIRHTMDRDNLLAIHTRSLSLHTAGVSAAVIVFGAADNLEYDLTPAEALKLCEAPFDRATGYYVAARALKDGALAAAVTAEDVSAINAIDEMDDAHWS